MTWSFNVSPRVQRAIDEADQRVGDLDEMELASQLTALGPFDDGDKKGSFAAFGALYFYGVRDSETAAWQMYWQPTSTWVDNSGQEHYIPDVRQVDDEIIEYWTRRNAELRHPVLRARYADLAWEIPRFAERSSNNPNSARPHVSARANVAAAWCAIDSYLEAVERRLIADPFRKWTYIRRAVELAAVVNAQPRLERCKCLAFQTRADDEAGNPAYPFWLFDNLVWNQARALQLTGEDKLIIVDALERALTLRTDRSNTERFDPIVSRDAADRLGRWRQLAGEATQARRAAEQAGAAVEAGAQAASALTGIAWLGEQLDRYRRHGDTAGVARVERAIQARAIEAQDELQRISVPIDIPAAELRAWADQVAGGTLEDGLRGLATVGLTRESSTESNLHEIAAQSVLSAQIPISIMRVDGFTSATIGSIANDFEGRLFHHAANRLSSFAPFMNVAFTRLVQKHELELNGLMDWVTQSPYFPHSRTSLLREGLSAWFTEDFVKTVHILIPQVEAALRDLLSALGGVVTKAGENGAFRMIGLGDVLSHERFVFHIPRDIRFHFRVLYTDPRGLNLRNDFAHGIAPPTFFGRAIANWLVHSVILIGLLRVLTGSPPNEPDGH